jgi:serine/threonine-protein kinase
LREPLYHEDLIIAMPALLTADYAMEGVLYRRKGAVLFAGRRRADSRSVLVKVSREITPAQRLSWRDFVRRLASCSTFRHPNLVEVLEITTEETDQELLVFTVMERISGSSLRDVAFNTERLTIGGLLDLLRGVASAIDFLHEHRVVHRDVKPDNILVQDEPMIAKLGDFGIALTSEEIEAAGVRDAFGTPGFMAPEQILATHFGTAVDIYAFAMCIYVLLTQRLAFDADDSRDLLLSHLHREPIPIHHRNRNWPVSLHKALSRSLAKNPEDRHPTAKALITEVADSLQTFTPFRLSTYLSGTFSSGEVAVNQHQVRR